MAERTRSTRIEELRNQKGQIIHQILWTCRSCPGSPISKHGFCYPAKAMMSGPCFVLCASHSTKNAFFCNMVRNGGCASTFKRLPVRTALMSSSCFVECFVSESSRQSSLRTCARPCICPLLLSGRNSWIKCIVSFQCSLDAHLEN